MLFHSLREGYIASDSFLVPTIYRISIAKPKTGIYIKYTARSVGLILNTYWTIAHFWGPIHIFTFNNNIFTLLYCNCHFRANYVGAYVRPYALWIILLWKNQYIGRDSCEWGSRCVIVSPSVSIWRSLNMLNSQERNTAIIHITQDLKSKLCFKDNEWGTIWSKVYQSI